MIDYDLFVRNILLMTDLLTVKVEIKSHKKF